MSENVSMSPSVDALAKALIAAQAELPTLPKDKNNPFFGSKYVGLDTVLPAALKVLTKHGLGILQPVGQDDNGGTTITTILVHESGQWISDTQPLLIVKQDPQGQGSAITYGRRYGLMAMIGLVADDDDDANSATPRPRAQPQERDADAPQQATAPSSQSGDRVIEVRFPGDCVDCGFVIPKGARALWNPDNKKVVRHLEGECPEGFAQQAAMPVSELSE